MHGLHSFEGILNLGLVWYAAIHIAVFFVLMFHFRKLTDQFSLAVTVYMSIPAQVSADVLALLFKVVHGFKCLSM